MSIEWTVIGSKYEISSKEHLLQLMSKGALYTDTGTPPSDYWSSDYVQTVDVDLEADMNISPIGTSSEPFSGSFDGSGYSITDWTYQNISEDNVGLFGYIAAALIENISLEGTWILSGGSQCGFLVGSVGSSSGVYHVTAEFSSGSVASSGNNVSALIGAASNSVVQGLTVKGALSSVSGGTNVAVVVGSISAGSNLSYVRNMVRFTGAGISGISCGGVCANVVESDSTFIMNAMIGSVTGSEHSGGVFSVVVNTSQRVINHIVSSMTGDIEATGPSGSAGGIASTIQGDSSLFTVHSVCNYSSGSITGTQESGGIAGSVSGGVVINNSVTALNGTVQYAGVQTYTGSGNSIESQIITGFGLNYTTSGVSVELTALAGSFGLHQEFSDLEYFPFEFSDNLGNNYTWEFVFGNPSGSTAYSQYTHIVISSSDVCGPIEVQLDLPDNSVEYVYLQNINSNEVVASPGLSITYSPGTVLDTSGTILYPIPPLVITTTSPFSVSLSWEEVSGSVGYRVDYGKTSSGSLDKSTPVESGTLSVDVANLDASEEYSFQVYASGDGTSFTIEAGVSGTTTMPANSPSGYILSRFLRDEVYDFSSFSPEKTSLVATIMGDLLGQDESVLMNVGGQVRELLVAGVSGSTLDIQDGDQYVCPFQATGGSGQSLNLEGIYQGSIGYNQTNDSLIIDGQEYAPGSSVIVGNTRITLASI